MARGRKTSSHDLKTASAKRNCRRLKTEGRERISGRTLKAESRKLIFGRKPKAASRKLKASSGRMIAAVILDAGDRIAVGAGPVAAAEAAHGSGQQMAQINA